MRIAVTFASSRQLNSLRNLLEMADSTPWRTHIPIPAETSNPRTGQIQSHRPNNAFPLTNLLAGIRLMASVNDVRIPA
jgi:hypothetical protein